jgi:signal transduction histidine kinase/Na+/proline symporter
MFRYWFLIFISFGYLALLFVIAYYGDWRSKQNRSIISNPYVYALSMAVYCTGWTFYGSVGRAVSSGLDFLTIYLGPMLLIPVWGILLKKIVRICKVQRITSIADFISARYGKSARLGSLVAFICVLGVIPYISLQIKAISITLALISANAPAAAEGTGFLLNDTAFYVTLVLAAFTILFGTRSIDTSERHEGLVSAIAFESIVKLVAFLAVGMYVTFGLFDGFDDLFGKAAQVPELEALFTYRDEPGSNYGDWFWHMVLSMFAIILLPRQFQVAVVENVNEQHISKAMWLFPLYLFAINIFVLPIALGGALLFNGQGVDADTYVLTIPMYTGREWLTMLVYIGGFSASTGMVITAVIALSTMISNNLFVPVLITLGNIKRFKISSIIIMVRRVSIIAVLILAYLYFKLVGEHYTLVSIGLTSFTAVAQFAPAFFGGLFWKQGTKTGAMVGLMAGFGIWFYTLILPSLTYPGFVSDAFITHGPWGIEMLRPMKLFGLEGMDAITHALIWSLFVNIFLFVAFSFGSRQNAKELNQAEVFVDIFKYSSVYESSIVWKGTAYVPELKSVLINFLGKSRTETALLHYATTYNVNLEEASVADSRLVNYAEKLLAGAIGAASSRIIISSIVQEEPIQMSDVMRILQESQQLLMYNKELRRKSIQLKRMTEQLTKVNLQLKEMDVLKDEFITTVTHELRTPLTSVRALSEILYDNPDLSPEQQRHFLGTIIKETERLSRLISQVLDLEKFDSGKQEFNFTHIDAKELITEAIDKIKPVADDKGVQLDVNLHMSLPALYADRDRLTQVLINVLSNAVKYSEKEKGCILVTAFYLENALRINIKDDGPGISQENHERIFDRFYQVSNRHTIKQEGSGLGLAICKKIIEFHNGKIWVESTPGEGAKFCISLPVHTNISKYEPVS